MMLVYDPLPDLTQATPRLQIPDGRHGALALSSRQRLLVGIENGGWLHAVLPLPASVRNKADGDDWQRLHVQPQLPDNLKFVVYEQARLALQSDLPMYPRALLQRRWATMPQAFKDALLIVRQRRSRASLSPARVIASEALCDAARAALDDGGWDYTETDATCRVSVPLRQQVHQVNLVLRPDTGTLRGYLEYPLPSSLAAVCQRAIAAFLLEGNARLRLVRLGLTRMADATDCVVAEASLALSCVQADTIGQLLDALAVAAHLIWPVLPALNTETVARLALQTRDMSGVAGCRLTACTTPSV
jgi:hypothetical protein